jgi:hypothetical protein
MKTMMLATPSSVESRFGIRSPMDFNMLRFSICITLITIAQIGSVYGGESDQINRLKSVIESQEEEIALLRKQVDSLRKLNPIFDQLEPKTKKNLAELSDKDFRKLFTQAFLMLSKLSSKPDQIPEALKPDLPKKSTSDLNSPRIEVNQPIIISIPTNENATEFRHLAIELTITVGRVQGEDEPNFDLIDALTKEQFLETAKNFKPWINDRVNKIASDYSYLELQQEKTKTEFRKRLRDELNGILKSYGMKPRFRDVLFTRFIFSD